ncbi:hypothetical protein BYT27DRAFT_7258198 [Phlegmacium glaucopus]|nr:hypothetical protein BYT27DRAFT_7258198 [Phlegmacium glaucopus]
MELDQKTGCDSSLWITSPNPHPLNKIAINTNNDKAGSSSSQQAKLEEAWAQIQSKWEAERRAWEAEEKELRELDEAVVAERKREEENQRAEAERQKVEAERTRRQEEQRRQQQQKQRKRKVEVIEIDEEDGKDKEEEEGNGMEPGPSALKKRKTNDKALDLRWPNMNCIINYLITEFDKFQHKVGNGSADEEGVEEGEKEGRTAREGAEGEGVEKGG